MAIECFNSSKILAIDCLSFFWVLRFGNLKFVSYVDVWEVDSILKIESGFYTIIF